MRGSGAFLSLVALAALAARPGPAAGDRSRAPRHEVDVEAALSQMVVLTDGRKHYVALVPLGDADLTFYGDGKTFHQLRVYGSSKDTGAGTESRRFWAPVSTRGGDLEHRGGRWTVRCSDRVTPLVQVSEKETRAILARAVFKKPFWKRQAYALGRTDAGVYYYVDKLRDDNRTVDDPNPATGFRLFVGRKGRLKEQRLTDSTLDSKGVVLSTKGGHLTVDHASG